MKKYLILILILVAGNSLLAQEVKFGLKTGINFPSLQPRTGLSPGGHYKVSAKFLIGTYAELNFGDFILQPGILFSVKGNKAILDSNTISFGSPVPLTIDRNVNLYYLEVPVNFLFNHEVKAGTLYAGGGPYAGYAISNRIRSINKRDTYLKQSSVSKVEFGNEPDQIKTTDFGVNFLAGIKLKNGMDFGASYGLGLANISNQPQFKSQNRVVSVFIGYLF